MIAIGRFRGNPQTQQHQARGNTIGGRFHTVGDHGSRAGSESDADFDRGQSRARGQTEGRDAPRRCFLAAHTHECLTLHARCRIAAYRNARRRSAGRLVESAENRCVRIGVCVNRGQHCPLKSIPFPIVPRCFCCGRAKGGRIWRERRCCAGACGACWDKAPLLRRSRAFRNCSTSRGVVDRIDYWLTGSQLESAFIHLELARHHYPEDWQKIARLKMPAFVRLTLDNPFPRTFVTTRFGRGLLYGPFASRAAAERFDAAVLDLFQVRRCEENLDPSPAASRLHLWRDEQVSAPLPAARERRGIRQRSVRAWSNSCARTAHP